MESVEFLKLLPYVEYLKTEWWNSIKRLRLAFDKYKCVECHSTRELDVHHLTYENLGDENIETDLITLCRRCHLDKHYFKTPSPTKEMLFKQLNITQQEFETAKLYA